MTRDTRLRIPAVQAVVLAALTHAMPCRAQLPPDPPAAPSQTFPAANPSAPSPPVVSTASIAAQAPAPNASESHHAAEELPYQDSGPPRGYHLDRSPRVGFIIGGVALFAPAYLLSVGTAANATDSNTKLLYVPIFGPWMALSKKGEVCPERPNNSLETGSCIAKGIGATVLLLDGAIQAGGAALITLGFALPRKRFVRDSPARLAIVPQLSGALRGMSVVGQF